MSFNGIQYKNTQMSSQPFRGIINAENPNSHLPQMGQGAPTASQPTLQDVLDQNEHIKSMIERIKREKADQQHRINQQVEPEGFKMEFSRRNALYSQKIQEMKKVVASQEKVIGSYQQKFKDFEDNLFKIMKLDKDIHQRLVNPQPNPTLQTNVRNVLVALNGKAPYDKLLKMIESIRV